MMKHLLSALFVFIAASSFALDITTRDGKAYRDCAVRKVEAEGLRITHRDGTAFLDFDELPSALQKQYGWTEETSAARKARRKVTAEAQRIAGENARREQAERVAAIAQAQQKEIENANAAINRKDEESEAKKAGLKRPISDLPLAGLIAAPCALAVSFLAFRRRSTFAKLGFAILVWLTLLANMFTTFGKSADYALLAVFMLNWISTGKNRQ